MTAQFSGPVQNITAAGVSITAKNPPPEGQAVVPLAITLTPQNFAQSFSLQIGGQSTTGISQVVSLYIDNTQNNQILMLTHGAANQTVAIPAGGGAFVPTCSTTALIYTLSASVPSAPTNNVTVNISLYNYFLNPSIYGNTIITEETVINTSYLDNPFTNPACSIAQRGPGPITVPTAGSYTLDGWLVVPSGAGVTALQSGSIGIALNSLQIKGATSNTDVQIIRRIESFDAAPFNGEQVTLQFKLENNTGSSLTPNIVVKTPTGQDVFTTLASAQYSGNTQACLNGTTTQCAVSFPITSSVNGLQIAIDVGALTSSSQTLQISEIDLQISPNTPTGLVSTPGLPRIPLIGYDLRACQRYLFSSYGGNVAPGTATRAGLISGGFTGSASTNWFGNGFSFPTMRAVPAIVGYWDGAGNPSRMSGYAAETWTDNGSPALFPASIGTSSIVFAACDSLTALSANTVYTHILLSAEL